MITDEHQAGIDALRMQSRPTFRVVSEGMERCLYLAHPVLDRGFVRMNLPHQSRRLEGVSASRCTA